MKRKLLSVLLCTVLASSLLFGCSSNDNSEADNTTEATEEPATETSDSAGGEAADTNDAKTYKFGFTEMSAGSFFDACYGGLAEVIEANGDTVVHVEGKADSAYQLGNSRIGRRRKK